MRKGAETIRDVRERVRHDPYKAAIKQLLLLYLTSRRIRSDLMSMYRISHGLLEFPTETAFNHLTRPGLCGHAFKYSPAKMLPTVAST